MFSTDPFSLILSFGLSIRLFSLMLINICKFFYSIMVY